MIYRAARIDDANAVALLHARSWQRSYRGILRDEFLDGELLRNRQALWTRRLTQPPSNQYVLVAVDGVDLVGFACVYGAEDAKWGSMLDNLHVRADVQARGVGRQLIGRAASWSREHYSTSQFYLWVFEQNHAARGFYESLGATNSETIEAEAPGGGIAMDCRYNWTDVSALVERCLLPLPLRETTAWMQKVE